MNSRELANEILYEVEESKIEMLESFILVVDNTIKFLENNETKEAIDALKKVKSLYIKMIIDKAHFKKI